MSAYREAGSFLFLLAKLPRHHRLYLSIPPAFLPFQHLEIEEGNGLEVSLGRPRGTKAFNDHPLFSDVGRTDIQPKQGASSRPYLTSMSWFFKKNETSCCPVESKQLIAPAMHRLPTAVHLTLPPSVFPSSLVVKMHIRFSFSHH